MKPSKKNLPPWEPPSSALADSPAVFFRPVIALLLALMGGIVLGVEYAGLIIGAAAAALAAMVHIVWCLRVGRSALASPLLIAVALGYLSIQPWTAPAFPANHIIHFTDAHRWNVVGRVEALPQLTRNRTRFILRLESLGDPQQTIAVRGRLKVTVMGRLPRLAAGDRVSFDCRPRSFKNFNNPGGFDYQRYMAFKGIWASAWVRAQKLSILERHPADRRTNGLIPAMRVKMAAVIDRAADGQAAAVLKALIVGDRSAISPSMRAAFNRAGVGHLLAISGLHIGIVATVAFFFFQRLLVWVKPLLWRAWTRKTAAVLSMAPVLLYGLIAGMSPSTQRAVIMVLVFMMTFLFASRQDSINTLALAAMAILVASPGSLYSISFQLSFAAVFSIIYGLSRLPRPAEPARAAMPDSPISAVRRRLFLFLMVSAFAICGSLPLVMFYFNQVSLIGLAVNFVIVPLVGFIVIPLGLAGLFVLPLSMGVASGCVQAAIHVLSLALDLVDFFADLPFAAVQTVTPNLFEIGCYYLLGWALLNLGQRSSTAARGSAGFTGDDANQPSNTGRRAEAIMRRLPRVSAAVMVMVLTLALLAADSVYWMYQRFWHPDLRVTAIDVGHGTASLVELPGGHTILVDGGGFADNAVFDMGARVVAPFLWRKKIRTVDELILSHPNSDHLNGLIYIAGHFHVKKVWTNGQGQDTLGYAHFMDVVRRQKILLPPFATSGHRRWINGVEVKFLYPPEDFLALTKLEKWRNTNNNSLVVRISMGMVSFLFPGDIMAAAEKELVRLAGNRLASTVLMAPHHGSRSSSSAVFLDAVKPAVVIFSAGRKGRYRIPHPAVVKRYAKRNCRIYCTAKNGAVRLVTDGRQLTIRPFEGK